MMAASYRSLLALAIGTSEDRSWPSRVPATGIALLEQAGNHDPATMGAMLRFAVMMTLDVALG